MFRIVVLPAGKEEENYEVANNNSTFITTDIMVSIASALDLEKLFPGEIPQFDLYIRIKTQPNELTIVFKVYSHVQICVYLFIDEFWSFQSVL